MCFRAISLGYFLVAVEAEPSRFLIMLVKDHKWPTLEVSWKKCVVCGWVELGPWGRVISMGFNQCPDQVPEEIPRFAYL
jgi:hypothetical protein